MGIQINGNTNNINAGIGSLSIEDINELDIVGVATAANFKTGVSNLHDVGLTLTGGQIDVGSNIKIGTAGVVTATSFVGSGANLTGIDTDLVSDSSPQLGGTLDTNSNNITFADNVQAVFGTGSDSAVRFNGTDLVITTAGKIKAYGGDTGIEFYSNDNSETLAKFIKDGAVELYHNNAKTLYTNTTGAVIKGGNTSAESELKVFGNEGQRAILMLAADDGDDNADYWQFQARTDGNLNIQNYNGGSWVNSLILRGGGAAELYHNNTKRLETTSTGATVTGNLAFTSAGQGIDFGSSTHASGMTREILTDYEEGNWTPVFATAASGGSTLSNPSNTQATYVKVGRIVYLHLGVHGLTKNWAGSNTSVYIRGIPYRSYFNHSGHCIRGGYWGANDDDMNLYAQIHNYQTYISIQKGGGAQGRYEDLHWDDMHWEGYGNLTLEMTYETDQGT